MNATDQPWISIIVLGDAPDRLAFLSAQLSMIFPSAVIATPETTVVHEGPLPTGDAAIVDAADVGRGAIDLLRVLRARGFGGPIVVISATPDDGAVRGAVEAFGAVCLPRDAADESPAQLASALERAWNRSADVSQALARARRIFAAGQTALSLQHAINNPLAALMAEAQLLQLEELNGEQRGSVDRMVELCRRITALVRRLDALADG